MPLTDLTSADLTRLEQVDPERWPKGLQAIVRCVVCEEPVALIEDGPDWPGMASGDCCDHSYHDWWEGTIVIRPPEEGAGRAGLRQSDPARPLDSVPPMIPPKTGLRVAPSRP